MTGGQSYDIVVVGAGPAGVAAAVAGAAAGAKVLLVDSADRLGGTVTAGLHRSLCGLYADAPANPWDTLNAGVQRDVTARLARHDPEHVRVRQLGKAWVLEFRTSVWETVLAKMCEAPGLEVRLSARLVGVDQDGSRLTTVWLKGTGPECCRAKVFVDCTGEGALIRMAGADIVASPNERQKPWLAGFSVRLAGLTGDLEMLRVRMPYALAQAVEAGSLPLQARFTMFHPGPVSGQGVCKLAIPPSLGSVRGNCTRLEQHCSRAVPHVAVGDDRGLVNPLLDKYVRDVIGQIVRDIPECTHAQIVERSPTPLARDGGRLRGKYIVTREDVLAGNPTATGMERSGAETPNSTATQSPCAAVMERSGVRAWWPIEIWDVQRGPVYAYPPIGNAYTIPPEALQSDKFDNLLAAGACVSATRDASASIRAAGICLATGDAAGRLAAVL